MLNSISALRREMFALAALRPFRPILLVSERIEAGQRRPAARRRRPISGAQCLVAAARAAGRGIYQRRLHHRPGHRPGRQRLRGATSSGCSAPWP